MRVLHGTSRPQAVRNDATGTNAPVASCTMRCRTAFGEGARLHEA